MLGLLEPSTSADILKAYFETLALEPSKPEKGERKLADDYLLLYDESFTGLDFSKRVGLLEFGL